MMGVNRTVTESSDNNSPGNNMVFIEDYFERSQNSQTSNTSPVNVSKKIKKFVNVGKEEKISKKKKIGVRQNRRSENTNFLLSLVENDDDPEGEISFMEIVEPNVSAFEELFHAQEKMTAWNDFINQPEDEQERLLAGEWVPRPVPAGQDKAEEENMEKEYDIIDKREVHPAFSASECFQRVDNGFRAFLKKKHVPWGVLKHLESQLIPFFVEWPSSIFISQLPGPLDRLLLHALCQYLDLCSFSFDGEDGLRHTQVENRNDSFLSPLVTLSQYLNH